MNINTIVKKLKEGKIIALPTDTVYGIIADAYQQQAVNKIFEAKNRDYQKPFLVLISQKEMLREIVTEISPFTQKIIDAFWPGPLSILFPKSNKISDLITASSPFVAVRYPKHDSLCQIIDGLGHPIVAPSANISGQPSAHCYADLTPDLLANVDDAINGGILYRM